MQDVAEPRNKMFRTLINGDFITDKEMKYFTFNHKRACNLGKLYFFPKFHQMLFDVPSRPVISNCRTPTEKTSEFLDSHLKTMMQESWSYIKDPGDFINKMNQTGDILENAILVTVGVVGHYPSIPQKAGLKALKTALEKRERSIPTEKLIWQNFCSKTTFFNSMVL